MNEAAVTWGIDAVLVDVGFGDVVGFGLDELQDASAAAATAAIGSTIQRDRRARARHVPVEVSIFPSSYATLVTATPVATDGGLERHYKLDGACCA